MKFREHKQKSKSKKPAKKASHSSAQDDQGPATQSPGAQLSASSPDSTKLLMASAVDEPATLQFSLDGDDFSLFDNDWFPDM